jgi:hypothetical protein
MLICGRPSVRALANRRAHLYVSSVSLNKISLLSTARLHPRHFPIRPRPSRLHRAIRPPQSTSPPWPQPVVPQSRAAPLSAPQHVVSPAVPHSTSLVTAAAFTVPPTTTPATPGEGRHRTKTPQQGVAPPPMSCFKCFRFLQTYVSSVSSGCYICAMAI